MLAPLPSLGGDTGVCRPLLSELDLRELGDGCVSANTLLIRRQVWLLITTQVQPLPVGAALGFSGWSSWGQHSLLEPTGFPKRGQPLPGTVPLIRGATEVHVFLERPSLN